MKSTNRIILGYVCGCMLLCSLGVERSWGEGTGDVGELNRASWWTEVQGAICREESQITGRESAGTYRVTNRAANLRACFSSDGIEVASWSREAGWHWGFELSSLGREGVLEPVGRAEATRRGRRVEYIHGGVTAWYENHEKGIEQGFLVTKRPEGNGALILRGTVTGDLDARLADGAQSVTFFRRGKAVLVYGNLRVEDAGGRVLPSRLTFENNALGIVIEDEGTYPIYVDPLLTTPSWTAEGNQVGAHFGYSVASAGDVNGDGYTDVIVGAHTYSNGQTSEGRAYVFLGGASGLASAPTWATESNEAHAHYGYSVAGAGDVNNDGYSDIIVGADNGGPSNKGRFFVYHGGLTGLSVADTVEGDQSGAKLGSSVAAAGDVNGDGYGDVIVGAPYYASGEAEEGRVYVFPGSALGISGAGWSHDGDLVNAHFGISVASAGDVNNDGYSDIVVGAQDFDDGIVRGGMAFVFHGSPTGLSGTADWSAGGDDPDYADEEFGCSVACAGDVNGDTYSDIIIGARKYSILTPGDSDGKAYVFCGGPSGLSATPVWTKEGSYLARFGYPVAGAGDVNGDSYSDIIIGALWYDNGPDDYEGAAYVFHGGPTGPSSVPYWFAEGNQVDAFYGKVAGAGDVNDDGYHDVIVGAFGYFNGEYNEGGAFVYNGSPDPSCSIVPGGLDFGAVVVGSISDLSFTITNAGFGLLDGQASESCNYYSIVSGGGAYSLAAGESLEVTVRFEPTAVGTLNCAIDLGSIYCTSVSCAGIGGNPPACLVQPVSLDFDTVLVGSYRDTTFSVKNTGGGTLAGTVSETCSHFSIVSGADAYSLATGDSLVVTVRFAPVAAGADNCTIDLGSGLCAAVSCVGLGQDPPLCLVQPVTLDFDTVAVGSYRDTSLTIKNIGSGTLAGSVIDTCSHYSIISGGGAYSLAAGESTTVTVRFAPTSAGTQNCVIETGSSICSDVACAGVGAGVPVAEFSANATTVHTGDSVCFTDLSTGGISSWRWLFGDGDSSTVQNPCHSYALPDTYTVCLTVSGAYGSDALCKVNYIAVYAAGTWYVPSQCLSIQAGIDSAVAGDTVLVACGTYHEHDVVMKSAVYLTSETGQPDCVTVDAQSLGRVFYAKNIGGAATIRGFRITGGSAQGGVPDRHGGGLYAVNSSPSIVDCIFGANTAVEGAGAFCDTSSSPNISNCVFSNNVAQYTAGAVMCMHASSPMFDRCDFTNNVSVVYPGGAVDCQLQSSPAFTACTFSKNSSGDTGGAIDCYGSSNATFNNCIFAENTTPSQGGAAVFRDDSQAVLTDCIFYKNSAGYRGGALEIALTSVIFDNCTFSGNSAPTGGAMYLHGSANVTMNRSIVALSTQGEAINCDVGSSATLMCCNIYGNASGDWIGCIAGQNGVSGNISQDPLFCQSDSADYRLQADSPCAPFSAPNPTCDLIGARSVGCIQTGVGETDATATTTLRVRPAVPNPFSPATTLWFYVPDAGDVRLSIFDVNGRHICDLVDETRPAGWQVAVWNGVDGNGERASSGVYFYRATWGGDLRIGRVVLIK